MGSGKTIEPRGATGVTERRSSKGELDAFLDAARATPKVDSAGRLILAIDATMSRQPTWDVACAVQGQMFGAVAKTAKLAVQLVYYRGFGECRASRFVGDAAGLAAMMGGIECRGGQTQIGKVLAHGLKENARGKVDAIVFIGDAMEEDADKLCHRAGELGLRGVPVFVFQEGRDAGVERVFKEIARLSRGAWFRFDRSAPDVLGKLLSSIAVFASGGSAALKLRGTAEDRLLLGHLGAAKS